MFKNLRQLFFFSLLLTSCMLLQAQTGSKFDQLLSVNSEWKNQADADPDLYKEAAFALPEQQLIQWHLRETEKLLRSRKPADLSTVQMQNRLKNLDVLHQYWQAGSFPINTLHNNRQPYFIDDFNTYCAVGYLMKMSGADEMAKAIHHTQNFNYLADIHHPDLMKWVANSGLTLDELALIQPGYINDRPVRVLEFHYNNTGTDVGEYIEFQQPLGFFSAPVSQILFYNQNDILYKTLLISQMQQINTGSFGSVLAYTFPSNENFSDKGKFELRAASGTVQQLVVYDDTSVATTTSILSSPVQQRYSIGENETTSIGSSLSFCGHTYGIGVYNDITLQILPTTLGTVNPCLILPVTLTSFNYKLIGNTVNLLWETVSELNLNYFELQRSGDGSNFNTIDKIFSTGNSNSLKKYSLTDGNPAYANHYRLKQVDKDGKFSYSKILYVVFAKANPLVIVQNPVKQILQVQVNTTGLNIGSLTVYDFSGRTVMKTIAKEGTQYINVSSLATGKYLVRLNVRDGQVYNQQFIKQ